CPAGGSATRPSSTPTAPCRAPAGLWRGRRWCCSRSRLRRCRSESEGRGMRDEGRVASEPHVPRPSSLLPVVPYCVSRRVVYLCPNQPHGAACPHNRLGTRVPIPTPPSYTTSPPPQ